MTFNILITSLLCLFIICSCSHHQNDSKKTKDKKVILEEKAKHVKIERSLFGLVGCLLLEKIEVKAGDSKELMIKAKNEAVKMGGDTLNNLAYGRKNNFVSETIFSEDDIEYAVKADVYRCHKGKKSSYVQR